jgi:hypothetical protein
LAVVTAKVQAAAKELRAAGTGFNAGTTTREELDAGRRYGSRRDRSDDDHAEVVGAAMDVIDAFVEVINRASPSVRLSAATKLDALIADHSADPDRWAGEIVVRSARILLAT